ncbi:MAG: 30S ribosomal protein S12 methylthiotransferase RimO [Acidimicrobiia bacterium]|nr:30S ribosomal protein S12 methylthiotransferase RimO [Acidimicrobiia bacterium]
MPSAPRVWLATLGCAKNQVDSEKLLGRLSAAGFGVALAAGEAEVVMVNTCAFVEAARRESVDAILELAREKPAGARLVVLGCLAQRYQEELVAALPEADAVVPIERYGDLVDRLAALTGWEPTGPHAEPPDILDEVRRPTPSTPYAYLKVAEGCDKPCSFCAIPQFRGPQRSRRPTEVRAEAAELASAGVKELVLVAQDLTGYGRDLGTPGDLVDLLGFLGDVPGLRRLRLLYLHPREVSERLVQVMTSAPLVAPYFDLSLQHSSGRLLRAMRRPGDGDSHLGLIERIRAAAPTAALRSSFIVGFPGETEDEVSGLADFLETAGLDWAGFFPYSPEEGTIAKDLAGRVPAAEAAERIRVLSALQERITAERSAAQVGREVEVLVDLVEDGTPVGRSHREAPEIDGMVVLDRGREGEWLRARITGSYGSDTVAEVLA